MSTSAIATGHIRLILAHTSDDFYLDIPISVVNHNCVRPIKYLRFLGWCIIGILGTVRRHRKGADIGDDGSLLEQRAYFYVYAAVDKDASLKYAVDPEVIKPRSNVSSSNSSTRASSFKASLVDRDASCIFTDAPPLFCEGTHIIPFHKSDEWFDLIVKNRPASGEDVSTLTRVNDQRNGMLLGLEPHIVVESRQVVVVKTPNLVLDVNDIPPRCERNLREGIKYPDHARYTLQWLHGDEEAEGRIPNNSDATFRKHTRILKPSPLLLHYNYGAAAVKWWGHGKAHLGILNRPAIPRPSVAVPSATGPIRTKRTADHLQAASQGREARAAGRSAGSGVEPDDREAPAKEEAMDPDEIVMLFWANTPAAHERRKRKAEDQRGWMEQWRGGVVV
ncbi:hypothetical protein B0H10DRAFT_1947613 [Mycena sp. CBHHK59/15]|nr:hypothetical protein B0H10DRAFT_1947613 [Mycena sp. CBHHK59/15]